MIEKDQKQIQQSPASYQRTTAKKEPHNRQMPYNITPRKDNYEQREQNKMHKRSAQRIDRKKEAQRYLQTLMDKSQYTEAEKVQATINYLTNQQKARRRRILQTEHSRQKMIVKQAHNKVVRMFRQTWSQVFNRQQQEERNMLQRLNQMGIRDRQQCRQRIIKRSQSAKPYSKIAKIYELEQIQQILRKRGKTQQLRHIREQKKRLIVQCKRQHQRSCTKIAQQQQKKLLDKQTKRYNSFMHRIESKRKQNERNYKRQEHRLKQKYKNILKNLQHEQKLSLLQI